MPLYDFQCGTCDRVFEAIVPSSQIPAGPPCATCQGETMRVWLPPRTQWSVPDAVVVYQAPDGSFRYPGENGGSATAKYDRMGYKRIEARGVAEVRALERRLNAAENSHQRRLAEDRQAREEHGESMRRSELFRQMASMSRLGRDVARAAINRHNNQRHRGWHPGAGLHIDAYSNDRSNRDDSRGGDGRRRRD